MQARWLAHTKANGDDGDAAVVADTPDARIAPLSTLRVVGIGLAASARFAIAPPRPTALRGDSPGPAPADLAAEGYASLFARRYLTWNVAEPGASQRGLAAFVGSGMEPGAGLRLPQSGEQHVEWAEVVQERSLRSRATGLHGRRPDGHGRSPLPGGGRGARARRQLSLTGYPAFVGAPGSGPATGWRAAAPSWRPGLATVVGRALRNYLAALGRRARGGPDRRRSCLAPRRGAAPPSVQRIDWLPDRRSVLAVVQAQDGRGAQYTLGYELDVALAQGRWEVSAIQMDPIAHGASPRKVATARRLVLARRHRVDPGGGSPIACALCRRRLIHCAASPVTRRCRDRDHSASAPNAEAARRTKGSSLETAAAKAGNTGRRSP